MPALPLLFAAVSEVLLRRLERDLPGDLILAFADDTAAVVHDMIAAIRKLAPIFQEFASISGLTLNLPKTVVIPLTPGDIAAHKANVSSVAPDWAGVVVACCATYLGLAVQLP